MDSEYKCDVCKKKFTGLVCFQQHEASEKHKKNVRLHLGQASIQVSPGTSADNNPELIPCRICNVQLIGMQNYQDHVNSVQHAEMVQKKSSGSDATKAQTECINGNVEISEVNNSVSRIPYEGYDVSLGSYAHCTVCRKQFSGPESHQQHLDSSQHKKKMALNGQVNPGSQMGSGSSETAVEVNNSIPNTSANLLNLKCEACQMRFSGPAPYKQHLASENHKKKKLQQDLRSKNSIFDTVDNDKIMPFIKQEEGTSKNFTPVQQEKGSSVNGSGSSEPFAKCLFCNMQFSGPEPYQLHVESVAHLRKVGIKESTPVQRETDSCSNSSSNGEPFAECIYCNMEFTGPEPYLLHVESASHKRKVGSKESTPLDQEKGSCTNGSGDSEPFAECKHCNMQFTGPEPYQLHVESAGHLRKIGALKNPVLLVYKCDVCNLVFSGPIPYNDHITSPKHKKKLQNVEFFKQLEANQPLQPDCTPHDKSNGVLNGGINSEYYCEVCDIQTTGAEPYRQHVYGEPHKKKARTGNDFCDVVNNNIQNGLSENNFKANDFYVNRDLILNDGIGNLGNIKIPDLLKDVKIFYPDDEIVFG